MLELALALDIEHYHITTSVSHLTCPLPPHQSSHLTCPLPSHHQSELELVLELVLALEIELVLALDIEYYRISPVIRLAPYHHISQSFDLPTATTSSVRASNSARDRASASTRHRALPYHCISQSFDLPPATTSVQSFDLPTAITSSVRARASAIASASTRDRASASARHRALPHQSSHLTCPLPPHRQSGLALALEIELVLALDIEHYYITALVSHLTCPLPPHQSVI